MSFTNVCTKCRFATNSDTAAEHHLLIHKARALKFEPLKTHICQALAESRTQEDTKNWEQALTLVNAMIDPCPECGFLWCQCDGTISEMALLMNPPECCPSDNLCEEHRAGMPAELITAVDAAPTKEDKDRTIKDYIAAAHARGEWR